MKNIITSPHPILAMHGGNAGGLIGLFAIAIIVVIAIKALQKDA